MTTVCLSDLINLSFGNCELRSMKFRVLQWCLQVIIQQHDLGNLLIEFRGNDSTYIQNEVNSASDAIRRKIFLSTVDEQQVNDDPRVSEGDHIDDAEEKKKQVVVIEKGKIAEHLGNKGRASSPSSSPSLARFEGRLRNLQAQLDNIGTQVVPCNDVLLERVRASQESKPVTELLETMKISKRMTGAEEEIDRLASLLETVVKEYDEIKSIMNKIQQDFGQDVDETLHQLKVVSGYINNIRPREAYYHTTLSKRLMRRKTVSSDIQTNKVENEFSNEIVNDFDEQSTYSGLVNTESMDGIKQELKIVDSQEDDINNGSEITTESDIVLSNVLNNEQGTKERYEKTKKNKGVLNKEPKDENGLFEFLEPVSDNFSMHIKTLNKLLKQHDQLKLESEFLTVQVNTLADFAEIILSEITRRTPNIEVLREKLREIQLSPSEYKKTKCIKRDILNIHMEICYRIDSIEGNISKYASKIQLQEDMYEESITNILVRIENLEKEMDETIKNINLLKLEDNKEKDAMLETLGEKVTSLDEELEIASVRINGISKEVESHEILLKKLTDDLFTLKSVKLDRFEFDELLSDKANIVQLNAKVSNDQFTQAYRFLTKSIERTAEKISTQALFWQKWVDNFEETLENKLSLEDFHELAEKLINEVKRTQTEFIYSAFGEFGPLARGTKLKYMKNLQCISCNRDVTMKMENDFPNLPILPKLTGHKLKTVYKEITKEREFSLDSNGKRDNTEKKTHKSQSRDDAAIE